MDETDKRQAKKDFWVMAAKHYNPAEVKRLQLERKKLSDRLFASFADQPDGGELVLTLKNLIKNCLAFAHYLGVRRGYKIGEGLEELEKRKPEDADKAKIARVLMNNPRATNREIAIALDNAEIRLRRSTTVPKSVRLWQDVVDEQYYKNFVWRIHKQVSKATRLRNWQTLMDKHEELRQND